LSFGAVAAGMAFVVIFDSSATSIALVVMCVLMDGV